MGGFLLASRVKKKSISFLSQQSTVSWKRTRTLFRAGSSELGRCSGDCVRRFYLTAFPAWESCLGNPSLCYQSFPQQCGREGSDGSQALRSNQDCWVICHLTRFRGPWTFPESWRRQAEPIFRAPRPFPEISI